MNIAPVLCIWDIYVVSVDMAVQGAVLGRMDLRRGGWGLGEGEI